MSAKPTLVQLILNAPAFAKSIMLAASASAHKTLLSLVKADVGLGNVDNTSDANKPVSTAQQTALDAKVTGPSSATDNAIARFDATTGKLIQNSGVTIDDSNNLTLASTSTLYFGASGFQKLQVSNTNAQQLSVNSFGTFGVSISVDGKWCMTGWNVARPLFCLGGTTSSFPAIKASAAIVAMRLADDSADAALTAAAITASGLMCCGVYTFSTVPSASSNTGKFLRISDRAQKHAYSDGTDWRFFRDDAIIS